MREQIIRNLAEDIQITFENGQLSLKELPLDLFEV